MNWFWMQHLKVKSKRKIELISFWKKLHIIRITIIDSISVQIVSSHRNSFQLHCRWSEWETKGSASNGTWYVQLRSVVRALLLLKAKAITIETLCVFFFPNIFWWSIDGNRFMTRIWRYDFYLTYIFSSTPELNDGSMNVFVSKIWHWPSIKFSKRVFQPDIVQVYVLRFHLNSVVQWGCQDSVRLHYGGQSSHLGFDRFPC